MRRNILISSRCLEQETSDKLSRLTGCRTSAVIFCHSERSPDVPLYGIPYYGIFLSGRSECQRHHFV